MQWRAATTTLDRPITKTLATWRPGLGVFLSVLCAVFLILVSYQNFLLFHTLAEIFAISVAILMCVVAWQGYAFSQNNYLMFLASGYFWIGALDLVHTLVYKGMNMYPIVVANPATQFWISARFLEALLLLAAPLFLIRSVQRWPAFLFFGAIFVVLYYLVMTGNFPDAFIEGQGLTAFKTNMEYVIIAVLFLALVHLVRMRHHLSPNIFLLMALSIVLTMGAELAFTYYISVYGLSNIVGHIFKFFSYWLIFTAVIRESLREPYLLLEQRVQERTKDLSTEVAERKKVELELLESKHKAEAASMAKSEFLASMSHELRTPLNAIIGFSDYIRSEVGGPLSNKKYEEYVKDIHYSGNHLLELINDILDVSAIEAGKLELSETEINVAVLADRAARQVRPRTDRRKVSITLSLQDNLPDLYADSRRVEEIFLNLLSNAVKFSHEKSEVIFDARVDESGAMVFSFTDHGIGMDSEDLTRAMEDFGQVKTTYVRENEGTGLGLPLTKALSELHGGSLSIDSEKGKGTVVTVRFPAERVIAAG